MTNLIELELAENRGKVLVNPDHIVSVTEEIALETGGNITRVVLNIYSQMAQATGNAPFILVEETAAEIKDKMDPPPRPTVDPNAPMGGIGQIVLWKLPPGKTVSDLFNQTGFGTDPLVAGWAICNGENGTINLKGRVPLGWDPDDTDFNTLSREGGSKTHPLSWNEMPIHGHKVIDPGHSHVWGYGAERDDSGTGGSFSEFTYTPGSNGDVIKSNKTGITLEDSGGGLPHNNLQPYTVCLFIQRIA